jgi:glutaredoxin
MPIFFKVLDVVVYSKPDCIFCDKAKALLQVKGIAYTEQIINVDITVPELFEKLGQEVKTVPQIVVDNTLIGGYTELTEYIAEKENDGSERDIINT